jgi:hypothetical protein
MNFRIYFSLFIITLCACNKAKDDSNISPIPKKSSEILFVVSGFGSSDTNITITNLISRLRTDSTNTYILKDVREEIKLLFPVVKAKIISSENNVPFSDTVIFITNLNHLAAEAKALKVNGKDFFEDSTAYPLCADKSEAIKIRKKITQLNLTGVTAITRGVCSTIEQNGTDYITENIRSYFEKADFVHISNEVSIAENCQCMGATMRFCSKEEHFKILKDLHCNIVELTGNHNRDYGDAPFLKTMEWYKKNNIKTFGGGNSPEEANTPLVVTLKDGTRLGFIGFNEFCPCAECADVPAECGANRWDSLKAKAVIKKMKNELKCNYIIASVQYGESDSYYPTPSQKKISQQLLNYGADMTYGSQAHQVQQITFINHKPLFYGLGNFIFDQMHRTGLRQAYFLQMYFYNGKLLQARPVFTFYQNDRRLHIATHDEAGSIRKEIFISNLLYGCK